MAITLNNGFKMPKIGLGVWRMEGKDIKDLIINAIKIGYRHFDCAGTPLLLFFSVFIGEYAGYRPILLATVAICVLLL